jgi:hypothetical protein
MPTIDRIYDPKDGLDVNKLKWGWSISALRAQMSLHDNPSVYQRVGNGSLRELGIMRHVGRVNRYKSLNLNGQIGRLNRKVYNVG